MLSTRSGVVSFGTIVPMVRKLRSCEIALASSTRCHRLVGDPLSTRILGCHVLASGFLCARAWIAFLATSIKIPPRISPHQARMLRLLIRKYTPMATKPATKVAPALIMNIVAKHPNAPMSDTALEPTTFGGLNTLTRAPLPRNGRIP